MKRMALAITAVLVLAIGAAVGVGARIFIQTQVPVAPPERSASVTILCGPTPL